MGSRRTESGPAELNLPLCVYRAAVNWIEWRDCFEHGGAWRDLPVLASDNRFGDFAAEYGLRWLGGEADRRRFRLALRRSRHLQAAIAGRSAEALDQCIETVRSGRGTRQQSAISKVAMFVAPSVFMPFDRFAKSGLETFGAKRSDVESYSAFSGAVSRLVPTVLRRRIAGEIRRAGLHRSIVDQEGFRARVLDVVLMSLGGRWSA